VASHYTADSLYFLETLESVMGVSKVESGEPQSGVVIIIRKPRPQTYMIQYNIINI